MRRLVLFLCLLIAPISLHAQWQRVGPPITRPTYGAVHFKSGAVWVGGEELYRTRDYGTSWEKIVFPDQSGITDICFLNTDTGIVSTLTDIWQTYDHGITWKGIARDKWQQMRSSYVFSEQNILAMAGGNLYISHDGGKSWTTRPAGKYNLTFAVDRNGSVVFPDVMTTDFGKSWSSLGPFPASSTDAWSIDIDSCDSKKIVVAVDNFFTQADGLCRMVNTTDGGMTWNVAKWWKSPNVTGALAVGPHSIYAGCVDHLMRSTDAGVTWNDMPNSPGTGGDSRAIAAITDNLIFVLDRDGQIWKTINSGGDSLPLVASGPVSYSIAPKVLFNSDTLRACSTDSVVSRVTLTSSGCGAPVLSSVSVIGSASSSYSGSAETPLIARVVFRAASSGALPAKAVLHYSNGSSDTVPLSGSASAGKKITAVTKDVNATTLGDEVDVPITFNGAPEAARIEFVMRYSPLLEYLGTFAPDNSQINIAGEQWEATSRIFAIAHDGVVAAHARFRVYNDSNQNYSVTIDSIALPDIANSSCLYYAVPAEAAIIPPSNCGATMISRFLHYGTQPRFSVSPNPSNGTVTLTSNITIQDATIEVFDPIGTKRAEQTSDLRVNTPLKIRASLASGIYTIRIRASNIEASLRMLVTH